ncbi:hypothetical protein WA026_017873 [Henosepilachna vigintioctopunctata]|uniref:Uncharacterized protein n=1 Tax=Henosepilachna vigintioctopunctata TaxID=420089 RepID=A0AAW1TZ69_9CUCU
MTSKSTIIESWLEEELENEDCALDGNFSDVEDIDDDFVLAQEVGSHSEIDGDDINLDEDCVGPQAETDSLGIYISDDEVPLAQVQERRTIWETIVFVGLQHRLQVEHGLCNTILCNKKRAYNQPMKV